MRRVTPVARTVVPDPCDCRVSHRDSKLAETAAYCGCNRVTGSPHPENSHAGRSLHLHASRRLLFSFPTTPAGQTRTHHRAIASVAEKQMWFSTFLLDLAPDPASVSHRSLFPSSPRWTNASRSDVQNASAQTLWQTARISIRPRNCPPIALSWASTPFPRGWCFACRNNRHLRHFSLLRKVVHASGTRAASRTRWEKPTVARKTHWDLTLFFFRRISSRRALVFVFCMTGFRKMGSAGGLRRMYVYCMPALLSVSSRRRSQPGIIGEPPAQRR